MTLPSPLRLAYFLFRDRRARVKRIKTAGYFLTLKRKETSVDRLLSGLFFCDTTQVSRVTRDCLTVSVVYHAQIKPFGNPCNEKSEQASEKGGHKCNE